MTVTAEVGAGQLADLIKQVQAGNEVVLMQDSKPVARLISAAEKLPAPGTTFSVRSIPGHRVLTPVIAQADIADELFGK
jgi:prevent-host-death family protein